MDDLTGRTFGLFTVVGPVGSGTRGGRWLCECACGNTRELAAYDLVGGWRKSCGCGPTGRKVHPNQIRKSLGRIEILLSNGEVCLVSPEDFSTVAGRRWTPSPTPYGTYVHEASTLKRIHREILGLPARFPFVDHIDGNPLNNQRSNLRPCTHQQNSFNQRVAANNTTGYRGVSRHGKKFQAAVRRSGVRYHLGTFSTAEEAAQAYNAKALELFGEFARLN